MFLFPETMSALDTTTVLQNGFFFSDIEKSLSVCELWQKWSKKAEENKKS